MSNIQNLANSVISTPSGNMSPTEKKYETSLVNATSATDTKFLPSLPEDQQEEIKALAPKIVDGFFEDHNKVLDFGKEAVTEVNKTVNTILREQKNIEIPQVDELLSNANRELNGFVAKYNPNSIAELEKKPNLFQRLFGKGKMVISDLNYDSKSVEEKLDTMAAVLVKNEDTLSRNITIAEMLVEQNNDSIENLVQAIGFLEAAQENATIRAHELKQEVDKLSTNTVEFQEKQSELSRMTDTVNLIERQHTEYVGRLYVAWATTPQMRNIQKVSVDMKQKMYSLRQNTIPTMKLTLSQLGILQTTVKAGATADAIVNANNAALQMLAQTSKEAIPMLAHTAQSSTLKLESVQALAESLIAQNDGIIKAIEDGRKERIALETAIVQAADTINNSTKVRDQRIIESIMSQAQATERKIKEAVIVDSEVESSSTETPE